MLSKTAHFPFKFLPFLKVKALLTSTDSDFYLYYVCVPRHDVADNAVVYTFARVLYLLSKNRFLYQKLKFIVGGFRKNAYLCKKLLGLNVIK